MWHRRFRELPRGVDPLGRVATPAPPLRLSWVALALGIAMLVWLSYVLP